MRRKLTRHFFRDEVLTSRLALGQRSKLRKTKERDSRCFASAENGARAQKERGGWPSRGFEVLKILGGSEPYVQNFLKLSQKLSVMLIKI